MTIHQNDLKVKMPVAKGEMRPVSEILEEQKQKDREAFAELDANGDGVLSDTELTKYGGCVEGHPCDPIRLPDSKLTKYDADGDGKVTEDEYLAGKAGDRTLGVKRDAETLAKYRTVEKVDIGNWMDVLDDMDANGDGQISEQEFINDYVADHLKHDGRFCATPDVARLTAIAKLLFARQDANGDGRITIGESGGLKGELAIALPNGGEVDFDEADVNGDGKVSEAELFAALLPDPPPPMHPLAYEKLRERVREAVAQIDQDGDGQISRAEARAFKRELAEIEKDRQEFADRDQDDDGYLTDAEIAGLPMPPGAGFVSVETIRKYYDRDGDGKVSEAEYLEGQARIRRGDHWFRIDDPIRLDR